ncbi:MAG: MFS transporter [Nitrososphaerales archaeon]|jgi:ACS family hexuronate transporter-like MFS transporter
MGNRYAALLAVSLPSFVYGLFRFSVGIVVPKIESAYSINDSVMGAIVSVSVGVVGVGVFASGSVAGRYGNRTTIVLGLLLFSSSLAAMASGVNLTAFSVLFLLASFGSGLIIPTSYAVVASILPLRRGIGAGLVTSAYNVGGLVGPALVGYLLLYYAWNTSFLVIPAVGLVAVLVYLVVMPGTAGNAPPPPKGQLRSLLGNRTVLLLAIAGFLADAAFVTYLSWTPKFLLTSFDVSGGTTALVDLLFGVGIGLGGLGIFVAGFLFDRIGGRTSSILGGVAATGATLGIYLSSSLLMAVALVVVGSFFLNWFWTLLTVMSQTSVPKESRSASTSLVQTVAFLGAFVGPGLAGILGGAEIIPLLIAVVVPNALYTLVMVLFYRDRPSKDLS